MAPPVAPWWWHSGVIAASRRRRDFCMIAFSSLCPIGFISSKNLHHNQSYRIPKFFQKKYCQTYVTKTRLNAALQCPKVHVLAQSTHVSIATFLQLNALIYGTVKLLGIHFKQSEHSIRFTPQNSNLQLKRSIHAIWHELNN